MVAALKNDFVEQFENNHDKNSVEHYLDKFQNSTNETAMVDVEEEVQGEMSENIESELRDNFQDTMNIESEDNDYTENIEQENNISEEDNVFEESNNYMNNNPSIEGFNGSKVLELNNEKVWLKSIMFGLLFYILSNPKVYDLTKGLSNQINKHMLHTLIFVLISYLLLLMI